MADRRAPSLNPLTWPANPLAWPAALARRRTSMQSSGSITLDELIGSFLESGYPPLILDRHGQYITRDMAVSYATMFRCVSLISGVIAELIANTAHVLDYEGDRVRGADIDAILMLLRESPDNELPASTWLEDFVADYLLDGNAIGVIGRGPRNRAREIRLAEPWTSRGWRVQGSREIAYQVRYDGRGPYDIVAGANIIHARWPRGSGRYTTDHDRGYWYARPPIQTLARALNIGLDADQWVRQFFSADDGGVRSDLSITWDDAPSPEVQANLLASIRAFARTRLPLTLFGGAKVQQLSNTPQDADALKLREFQVQEIGRAYGVPAPLLGVQVTQWGQGIEQLSRLFYRFGVRLHLARILAAMSWRMLPPGQKFAIDETELLRGDTGAIARLISATRPSAQHPAIFSRREYRRLLGHEPDFDDDWPDMSGMTADGSGEPDDGGAGGIDDDPEPALDDDSMPRPPADGE